MTLLKDLLYIPFCQRSPYSYSYNQWKICKYKTITSQMATSNIHTRTPSGKLPQVATVQFLKIPGPIGKFFKSSEVSCLKNAQRLIEFTLLSRERLS